MVVPFQFQSNAQGHGLYLASQSARQSSQLWCCELELVSYEWLGVSIVVSRVFQQRSLPQRVQSKCDEITKAAHKNRRMAADKKQL